MCDALALVATGVTSVQSLFWTVLPRNVAPGEHLPLALIAVGRTALGLVILNAAHRRTAAR
jgi:hypothetical protein